MRNRNIFMGLLFILAGVGLLANKLGFFKDINVFNLIVTIFLIYIIIKNIMRRNIFGFLVPLSLIAVIYSDYLGISSFNPWVIVSATALISIGLSLIFKPKRKYKVYTSVEFETDRLKEVDGNVYIESTFSEGIKYLKSEDLKSVTVDATFGSAKVYFDSVKFSGDTVTVNLDATFAGVELYIPKDWRFIDNTDVTFGSVIEKNKGGNGKEKTIILEGDVIFGSVDIIYV